MAKVLDMPKLSPTMTEGQLTVWHKQEGDTVGVDDLLADVETDKATMEFRSFDKGTVLKLLVPAGATVLLGQPVAILGTPGENISKLLASQSLTPPPRPQASASSGAQSPPPQPAQGPEATVATEVRPPAQSADAVNPGDRRVRASPYVRKLARERGIDLSAVSGTGPKGRVIARDLEKAPLASVSPSPAAGADRTNVDSAAQPLPMTSEADEERPLSMMRKAIARRLTESKQTVPHFYLTVDVDAGPLARLREQINADLSATSGRHGSGDSGAPKVSFNDLLVKACAIALTRVPECNASFGPEAILVHRRVDISVAVAVPDGLVTPVVRRADRKTITAIALEIRELAARAKNKKLRLEEMSGGTFSISNLGMFGIDSFAAVINPPEGAILAVGRVRDEPVVWEGAVVPGKRLALTLSCDHRVVDGAVGASFLAELRTLVERPTQMLVF